MRINCYLIAFVSLIQSISCDKSQTVIQLTQTNYDSVVNSYKKLFILIFDKSIDQNENIVSKFVDSIETIDQNVDSLIGFAKVMAIRYIDSTYF